MMRVGLLKPIYMPPLGTPWYWRNAMGEDLPNAVRAYLKNRTEGAPMSKAELDLVRAHLVYYINAPCWTRTCRGGGDAWRILRELRKAAPAMKTPSEICAWIREAMTIGLDPL